MVVNINIFLNVSKLEIYDIANACVHTHTFTFSRCFCYNCYNPHDSCLHV